MTLDFSSKPREAEMSSMYVPSYSFPIWQRVCGRALGAAPGRGTGVDISVAARPCYKLSREQHDYKREIQTVHIDSCMFKMRRKQKDVQISAFVF